MITLSLKEKLNKTWDAFIDNGFYLITMPHYEDPCETEEAIAVVSGNVVFYLRPSCKVATNSNKDWLRNRTQLIRPIENLSIQEVIGFYRDWETDRKSTRLNSSH